MKKMIHVSMGIDRRIEINPKEYFLEEKNLKDFVLQTDFNNYNFLTFQTIDIWEP